MADPTIVLVHGAFADASSFRALYDQLVGEGVTIVAPPNPLHGLSGGDGDYTKAVLAGIDGPVLLVIPTAGPSSPRQARLRTSSAWSTSPVSLPTKART